LHELHDPIAISGFGEDMISCATGVGTVKIRPKSKGPHKPTMALEKVFYVPKMPFGLLSVAVLLDDGYEFIVKKGHIDILKDQQHVATCAEERESLCPRL